MVEASTRQRIFHISEVLFQQILAVFVLLILWELFRSNQEVADKRTWHTILCVIGFALCMAEGVQIFRKESIVTFGHTREDKRKAHLIVMVFGFLCITAGISLRINEKASRAAVHFNTIHGRLGLSAWIITFVTLLGGVIAYQSKGIFKLSPSLIRLVHTILGITAYIIGIATLVYGLEYLMGGKTRGWIALVVLLVIYATYSLIGPFLSLVNYLSRK